MTEQRADYLTRFKPSGPEPLAEKPIPVFLPKELYEYVRSRPNQAEWLRAAIKEAALRDTEHNL
ncbi:MAG: hypothetical protein ACAF41_11990 [Leptolyngbya sp. BL-A-14]